MTNNTNVNTGSKLHMLSYRGIKTQDGRAFAQKTGGVPRTSCNMQKDSENFVRFHELMKKHPEHCCKKCAVKYRELIDQLKKAKAQ